MRSGAERAVAEMRATKEAARRMRLKAGRQRPGLASRAEGEFYLERYRHSHNARATNPPNPTITPAVMIQPISSDDIGRILGISRVPRLRLSSASPGVRFGRPPEPQAPGGSLPPPASAGGDPNLLLFIVTAAAPEAQRLTRAVGRR